MKIYIRAMSFKRDRARKEAGIFADTMLEHVIKIIGYHDIRSEHVPHWIDEIAGWLYEVDDITVKPGAKKLKDDDIRDTTFGAMGDELSDYRRALAKFKHDNKQGKFNYEDKIAYPDLEITENLIRDLKNCCFDIIEVTTPMLIDKKDHSKEEYRAKLTEIFNNYI